MISLLAAFQFLTIFPAFVRRTFTPRELGRAVGWYPLVGLALGGLLLGCYTALVTILPNMVSAALTLLAWILLTRALHLDGFVDMCDALFGGLTPERRLEIMKDSRIGAFGLAGGTLLLLTKFTTMVEPACIYPGLLLAPVLGRWVLSLAVFAFPYARQQGLGRDIKDNVGWQQVILATLIALAISWYFGSLLGLVAALLVTLTLLIGAYFILRLIPGLTGDSYGALCESTELVVLLFFMIGKCQ
jgi:adenosylcobinamide-GDP ribazoletransferase